MAKKASKETTQNRAAAERKPKAEEPKSRTPLYLSIAVLLILIAAAAYVLYTVLPSSNALVSFPTFKTNLNAATRIAILSTYSNSEQLNSEALCFSDLVQILSTTRSPSTIDFYEVNSTSCTYSPNGLGHQVTPENTTAASCLKSAASEPGIYLNYSDTNSSMITAYHLYIYGNSNYFAQCPVAVDLS